MSKPYEVNQNGELTIGGVTATELASQYETPLYVYDVNHMRQQMRAFKAVFMKRKLDYAVSYASKAFATVAMYEVAAQEDVHLDVVSGGEIQTALAANYPMNHVSFNGNNKSVAELEMAVDSGLGTIILDNFYELDILHDVLSERDKKQDVLLRITPGVEAHTHDYISTGQTDSKFGFDVASGQAYTALQKAIADPYLNVLGVSAHIGSQIFDVTGFQMAAAKLVDLVHEWGFDPQVINTGGGFGIRYTEDDKPLPATEFVEAIIDTITEKTTSYGMAMPAIWIEPGRAIVGPAGYNLYTIGAKKDVPGIRTYLSVDGGMGDNIRPALYEAKYEAVLANNPQAPTEQVVRIAGKYCESGDVLVWQQELPKTKPGDVLAVLATGAYGYSMASNYNRNPRPAVVFVEDGQSQLVVERETYADMLRLDKHYQ
ncbi:MAG TPA: diaminopimelate decarboxylase [Weissella thailandensis]|uniref:diaminopimelate decarboxylase n=1 Tax=Weissella thailandensis TaxID=89061 RepID=UPI001D934A18|nr:diaminopimelate decarboxylase [Weissella thailandensis]HJG85187.1 diaminopimelate decarboxylase [Weissella thailandensis]